MIYLFGFNWHVCKKLSVQLHPPGKNCWLDQNRALTTKTNNNNNNRTCSSFNTKQLFKWFHFTWNQTFSRLHRRYHWSDNGWSLLFALPADKLSGCRTDPQQRPLAGSGCRSRRGRKIKVWHISLNPSEHGQRQTSACQWGKIQSKIPQGGWPSEAVNRTGKSKAASAWGFQNNSTV